MSKYFPLIIGLIFFLLTGCISNELQHAASEAGKTIRAGKTTIVKGVATSTNKEIYKSLNLEFSDFTDVSKNYNNEKLSSLSALEFFKNLNPNDYLGYSKIQVTLHRGDTTVETLHDIERLSKVMSQLKIVESFLNTIRLKSYKDYEKLIDFGDYKKEVQLSVYNGFMDKDWLNGDISGIKLTGFRFTESKDKKIPETILWFELNHANGNFQLNFRIDERTNKIIEVDLAKIFHAI